ncbi:hypothetical protein ACLOJK_039026, partial [Asimina triloba]
RVGLVFVGNRIKVIFVSVYSNGSRFIFDIHSLEDKEWRRKELEYPPGDLSIDGLYSSK